MCGSLNILWHCLSLGMELKLFNEYLFLYGVERANETSEQGRTLLINVSLMEFQEETWEWGHLMRSTEVCEAACEDEIDIRAVKVS